MNKSLIYKYNLFYLALLIIWPIIRSSYINVDGAGRIQIFFTIVAIFVNGKELFNVPKAMHIWVVWILYALVNTYFKGFGLTECPYHIWVFNSHIIPLVIMFIIYKMVLYNYKDLVKKLSIFLIIYLFFGMANMSVEDTMSGTRYGNALGNSFFNNVIIIVPVMCLLYNLEKKDKTLLLYTIFSILFFSILISGHRKGFVAAFILIAGFFYAKSVRRAGMNIRSFFLIMGLFLVVYLLAPYILESTNAGQRFVYGMDDTEFQDNVFLKMVGNRALMYVEGFDIFLNHPITGIGLTNFINSDYSLGEGHILHTEYMVQLTECGIIGSSLFLAFFISMIVRAWKFLWIKETAYEGIIFMTGLLAIILINFTASCHNEALYFMLFGLLFARYDMVSKSQLNKNFNESSYYRGLRPKM